MFAQFGYVDTKFDGQVAGASRLSSKAARLLAGANIDLAGRARGSLGVGYNIRDYQAEGFRTVRGFVAEGRIELFPTELLTITTGARRSIEDATFGNTEPQPFYDNRFTLRGDYELLSNLIVSGGGEYGVQTFVGQERRNSTYRVSTDARFLVSRRLTLEGSMSYTQRRSIGAQSGNEPGEGRIEAGLSFHL